MTIDKTTDQACESKQQKRRKAINDHKSLPSGTERPVVSHLRHSVEKWARRALTQEKIAEAFVLLGACVVTGYSAVAIHVCMKTYTVAGF